MFKYFPDWW